MTTGLLALLTLLVVLGKFLDFVLGEEGDRQIKRRLGNLAETADVACSQSDSLPRRAAAAVESFLNDLFGPAFSSQSVWHCLYLSGTITCLVILVAIGSDPALPAFFESSGEEAAQGLMIAFVLVIGSNFAVDLLSLTATRLLLDATLKARPSRLWLLVGLQLALSYLFAVTAMNMTFSGTIFARGIAEGYFADTLAQWGLGAAITEALTAWWVIFDSYTFQNFLHPIREGQLLAIGTTNLLVFSLTAALPSIVYVVAIGAAGAIDAFDEVFGGFIRRIARRLATHKKPVFLNLALAFSGLITVAQVAT